MTWLFVWIGRTIRVKVVLVLVVYQKSTSSETQSSFLLSSLAMVVTFNLTKLALCQEAFYVLLGTRLPVLSKGFTYDWV